MSINSLGITQTQFYESKQHQNTFSQPSFRATEPLQADTVEIRTKESKQKKKLSTLSKLAIFAGTAIGGAVLITLGLHRGIGSHINKLYKDKLVLSNLPEKLEFKEAKTLDEAIKFSKEVLKIKEVDKDFTLDALNIANRGLVDVSNAHNGKVFMPPALRFVTPEANSSYLAKVICDIESKDFGNMCINRNYFNDEFLNKKLDYLLHFKNGEKSFNIDLAKNKIESYHCMGAYLAKPTRPLAELIEKFYKDPSKMTMMEKQKLYYSMSYNNNAATSAYRNPLDTIKEIYSKNKKFIKNNGINVNIEEISNKSFEEQKQCMCDLVKKLESFGKYSTKKYDIAEPTRTIHHEAGHLQDAALNLKRLDTKKWNMSFKEWSKLRDLDKKNSTNLRRKGVDEVNNRWGSIHKKEYKDLFENEPEKFKKLYPEFYEFLTNQETQITAGKVSAYAQTGIGEFIAETYAELIAGRKLPEDVMALYRKYNGPVV